MLNRNQRRIAHLPHDVYKAYDAWGGLLYVGVSVNVFKRLREHKAYSAWHDLAERIEVAQVLDRSAARAEEARCIRDDAPRFNVTKEIAWGCELSTEQREAFTLRRDEEGWFIDGEG